MSIDDLMSQVQQIDLIAWAKTIPPEHRIIVLIMSWTLSQCSEKRIYDSLFGDTGVDPVAQKEDFEKSCRDLGVDPTVLAAPLRAIVTKFGKVIEEKERS